MGKSLETVLRAYVALFLILGAAVFANPVFASSSGQGTAQPGVGARAAIVVEYPSGRVLYSKAEHDRLAPASTTKILTAILAIEYGRLDDLIQVVPEDLVGESSMGLVADERQTLRNLLYGLMLPSGNDAAMAIARTLGSQVGPAGAAPDEAVNRFAQMMNVRTAQLGLKDSHFLTPHGLDSDGHYSSAYDLASLSWYALHLPVFNEVVKQHSYEAPGHPLLNTNEMLTRYEGADGIKTGWTDAGGLCLVTSATRGGRRLISVVLNAPRWYADSAAILDYGFAKAAEAKQESVVLDIARRGAVSWLLANSTSAPPMPLPLAQGGGRASANAGSGRQVVAISSAPMPHIESGGAVAVRASDAPVYWLLALPIFAVGSAYALRRKQVHLSTLLIRKSGKPATPQPSHHRPGSETPQVHRSVDRSPVRVIGQGQGPNHAGRPHAAAPEQLQARLMVAVQLGWEGRQGSSMSEFLLAIKTCGNIEVDDVADLYQMNSVAFVALASAQRVAGYPVSARKTLLHGMLVMPNDSLIRIVLRQIEGAA